jgi:hypothetical protein
MEYGGGRWHRQPDRAGMNGAINAFLPKSIYTIVSLATFRLLC